MPEVKFGRKTEKATVFEESSTLVAVRSRRRTLLRPQPVTSAVHGELGGAELVLAFPEVGVEVFRLPPGVSLKAKKTILREMPNVRFAGSVLIDKATGEPVVYTENIFIKFVDGLDGDDCRSIIAGAGLTVKREVTYARNAFLTAAPEGSGQKVFDIALNLLSREDVEFCHPEIVRRKMRKSIFPEQWHLKRTRVNGIDVSAHAHVEAAHAVTKGSGVIIAILDDGFDIDHSEFLQVGKIVAPRDVGTGTDDPRPKDLDPLYPDDHGTACAGVAVASGTSGASGVAPQAQLMPIRMGSGLGSQSEANAFAWAADNGADVISCSWGPPDGPWNDLQHPGHNAVAPLPAITRLAIDYAATKGRNGRGCVICFASGNGNESVDNDGYASYEKVIAIGACNDRGMRSVYSDYGKALFCVFPSNDIGYPPFNHPEPLTPGIWTTDRLGQSGYNEGSSVRGDEAGDFTNSFGGTSSACPAVAGAIALMLSVNPDLTSDEVRQILRSACDVIDETGGGYDADGHSAKYGYGRVNCERAVVLAHSCLPQRIGFSKRAVLSAADRVSAVSFQIDEPATIQSIAVEARFRGDVRSLYDLQLFPPSSKASKQKGVPLVPLSDGSTYYLDQTAQSSFKGKNARGSWLLEISTSNPSGLSSAADCRLDIGFIRSEAPARSQTVRKRSKLPKRSSSKPTSKVA